ncbi:16S rRNA (cytidine(1402)-2'-O)-methyltransferase [Parachlamydia sp. AcF125]|uniref:16S rRNA (cytidine(1402)-2'-O)-methyltransferase n=1 Tax=Parachlamydia sp. AcF125 TaxID=2795736 RepID=UPI001BCA2210|nr:16S rRNA (cytidine(1402)-2'-O)-methyltransferase [Parachlamydia sp. AcF125]MBS4169141.1 Ribosomal RNA small subunit methyltransferase I [Parachlamydia sp. AcF125]
MLYLIATPIGNLEDITLRALRLLKECELILCEDTRQSAILLNHYEIVKPLKSFHKFNESAQEQEILAALHTGVKIALISDAGTPSISDPGYRLVEKCVAKGVKVVSIPGPCAAIAALACSGLPTDLFQFCGFLPRKSEELKKTLQKILPYEGTTICYESPHRLLDFLKTMHTLAPQRQLVVARELTKKFEEVCRGTAQALLAHWELHPLKGEVVVMIKGEEEAAKSLPWEQLTPQEHVQFLENQYNLSKKEAIKLAAEMRGIPKRNLYRSCLSEKEISD